MDQIIHTSSDNLCHCIRPELIGRLMGTMMALKRFKDHAFASLATRYDLSRIELDILLYLARQPHHNTATQIIADNHFTKSHVSHALKNLEEKGYITKSYHSCNHKTNYLSLSSKASPIICDGMKQMEAFSQKLAEGIDPQDLEVFCTVLSQFSANAMEQMREL